MWPGGGGIVRMSDREAIASDELDRYLDLFYGTEQGWLCVGVGDEPYFDETGRYRFGQWGEVKAEWPANNTAEFRRGLLDGSLIADVYASPYLMASPSRSKGNSVRRAAVHSEIDCAVDPDTVRVLGGCAVGSGTPRHAHVYVPLTESVSLHHHRLLCQGLSRHFGAKDSKIADNDLLRPAGLLNHKSRVREPGEPSQVPWLVRFDGVRTEPGALAGRLGVELTDIPPTGVRRPREKSTPAGGGAPVSFATDPFEIAYHPRVRRALAKVSGDRSADTMRVVRACFGAGLTEANARWAVRQRDDLAERLDQRHDDDVARCWRVCLEES
jgi:putative DNA primase/helicase